MNELEELIFKFKNCEIGENLEPIPFKKLKKLKTIEAYL